MLFESPGEFCAVEVDVGVAVGQVARDQDRIAADLGGLAIRLGVHHVLAALEQPLAGVVHDVPEAVLCGPQAWCRAPMDDTSGTHLGDDLHSTFLDRVVAETGVC